LHLKINCAFEQQSFTSHPSFKNLVLIVHRRESSSTSTTKMHTVEMQMLARGLRHLYSPFDPLQNPRS
jgi:hypothetical protein